MSIATAMNSYGGGEIHTCDSSNEITIFQYPPTKIFQYEGKSSTEMFANLSGYFDFVFLDGRLNSPDIPRLAELLSDHSIITLDDFEGSEKGVANLFNLRTHTRFQNFF